jgi:precorrin-2 dehydrogenase/sirohydrochlorin ferrochelatase
VSGYPVILDGSKVSALVVGGGRVALRKVRALLDGGVHVRVVATVIDPDLRALADGDRPLTLTAAAYAENDIADATVVIAATNDAAVNASVARDAMHRHRIVNVVDAPGSGSFTTPAVHRIDDLTVAVSAGRLPAAAAAIRDAIAGRFDERYAAAIADLRELRDRLLAAGDHDGWRAISA